MRVHIIINEHAGGGRGRQVLQEVHTILTSFQAGFITYSTEYADHASVIARLLIHRLHPNDRVLVIGGDGTIHQTVTTFYKEQAIIPIAIVPAGNNNDFHHTFQTDKNTREIIETLLFQHEPVNLPVMRCYNQETEDLFIVMSNIGFGFNAQVNAKAYELKKSSIWNYSFMNQLRYLTALALSLSKLESVEIEFIYDGHKTYYGDMLITSIMNTPYFSDGIPLNTQPQLTKHQLSLLLIRQSKPVQLIKSILKLFKHQQSLDEESLIQIEDSHLEVNLPHNILCEMDGENLLITPTTFHIRMTEYPFYI